MGQLITVYTTPNCVQCNQTKKFLDNHGLKYEVVDLSQDEEAMNKVKEMGYTSAPVVEVENDSWSGFRYERLKNLLSRKDI